MLPKTIQTIQNFACKTTATAVSLLCIGHVALAYAADIPGWRGDGNGRYPAATPPIIWAKTTNVIWKCPLPAYSASSPILVGERLYLCAETNTLICVDANKGAILWQKAANGYEDALPPEQAARARADEAKAVELRIKRDLLQKEASAVSTQFLAAQKEVKELKAQLDAKSGDTAIRQAWDEKNKQVTSLQQAMIEKNVPIDQVNQTLDASWAMPRNFGKTGYSWPTPVSDGKLIYALFGTGVAVCYDLDGNRKWIRLVEKPIPGYGLRTTPALSGNQLLVAVRNLTALNAATGDTNWTATVTPANFVLTAISGQPVAVTAQGEIVRVSDGKVLAKYKQPPVSGELATVSPVVHDGVVYIIRATTVIAVKLPDQIPETPLDTKLLWLWHRDVKTGAEWFKGSPVIDNGLLYTFPVLGNVLTALNAATGEVVYEKEIQAKLYGCYPSLALAGKYLFAGGESGTTVVIEAGREYKEISVNTLEPYRSSPIFSGKRMYLRGINNLYCIGE